MTTRDKVFDMIEEAQRAALADEAQWLLPLRQDRTLDDLNSEWQRWVAKHQTTGDGA